MTVYGSERISEIARILSLDSWWVESVIIEYFDCRRFAENGKLWTFDFNKITPDEIDQISDKKVIIPNFVLLQNIRPYDWAVRTTILSVGLPCMTLEDSEFIPEGLVNKTCFAALGNPIDVWDHKLGFSYNAIVLDDGIYYQWTVSEKQDLEGQNHHWYRSDICDLANLYKINRKIQEYRNSPLIKTPTSEFAMQVSEIYKKLEEERYKIRQKILEYHQKKKTDFNPIDVDVPDPPILSYFETIKPVENGYHVRTHMEPLFLRSAIRHLEQARKADEKIFSENKIDHDALLDRIEHSAMCIISAITCLESYINYIIKKYLPKKEYEIFRNASLAIKWLYAPFALGLSCPFDPKQPPFSDFSNLVGLRNRVIHHKPEYVKTKGPTSKAVNQFSFDNAMLAIKVVKEMVTVISSDGKIPMPLWITAHHANANYWDEVSSCLRELET